MIGRRSAQPCLLFVSFIIMLTPLTKTAFLNRLIQFFCLFLVFGFVQPAQAFSQKSSFRPYERRANEFVSAYVMTPQTRHVLYQYEANKVVPAASLTKLVGAVTFVNAISSYDRQVSLLSADEVGGGRLQVPVGTRLSQKDLLYSSIIGSANNTAVAMTRVGAKTKNDFIKAMNQTAKNLGASSSVFVDGSGIEVGNKTTAKDMAIILEKAMLYAPIRRAATTAEYSFYVRTPKGLLLKKIKNTNNLLFDDESWVVGGKTGYLPESGYHFITKLQPLMSNGKPDRSRELIVVVLGSPTKQGSFDAAKRIAAWAWNNHEFTSSSKTVARTP